MLVKRLYTLSLAFASMIVLMLLFVSQSAFAAPQLLFSPNSLEVPTSGSVAVDVIIDTDNQDAIGADAFIKYDSDQIVIDSVEAGNAFNDYPALTNKLSASTVIISGIASNKSRALSGQAKLATIYLHGKQVGSGQLTFDFKPGSSTDSNIADVAATGDILGQVGVLNYTVVQGTSPNSVAPPPTLHTQNNNQGSDSLNVQELDEYQTESNQSIFETIGSFFLAGLASLGLSDYDVETDAQTDTISNYKASTSPYRQQTPIGNVKSEDQTNIAKIIGIVIVSVAIFVIIIIVALLIGKLKASSEKG